MNRIFSNILEFVNPAAVVRSSVPPMDGALRANDLLDDAIPLLLVEGFAPDDVVVLADGQVYFSSGTSLWRLEGKSASRLADLGGQVSSLARMDDVIIAAVDGRGLVEIDAHGTVLEYCSDELVRECVTDLAVRVPGQIIASVGSRKHSASGWARSLLEGDRSGAIVEVLSRSARSIAEGLAWPSGLAFDDDGALLVSLSFTYRIERRNLSNPQAQPAVVLRNLPFYPGRIRAGREGWWVSVPFVRNRATELILDEPGLCQDLISEVAEGEWPVPRLRQENLYREPMQLGQLRVLGVLKPWAPARSYGLVFLLGRDGRVQRSFHSRVGGTRHGVTGIVEDGDRLIVAARGAGNLLELGEL